MQFYINLLYNCIMKPKYIETIHFNKYKEYCSIKCIDIVHTQNTTYNVNDKNELRGKYKGYLYCMKLFNSLYKRKKSIMNFEIYNHLKLYVSQRCTLWGEDKAIRDIMELLCNESNNT